MKFYHSKGFSMVEAMIAVAVCAMVLVALSSFFILSLRSASANTTKLQAVYLAEEGLEAVRLLRANGWQSNIASQPTATPLYLAFNGSAWQLTPAMSLVDDVFERKIVIDQVYRDGAQNIVASGGTLDPDTKRVTVTVSWRDGSSMAVRAISAYMSNIFNE